MKMLIATKTVHEDLRWLSLFLIRAHDDDVDDKSNLS